MTDADIDFSDIPPLTDEFFKNAELRLPDGRWLIKLPVDSSVHAWFRSLGDDWAQRMNAALKIYMQAHSATPGATKPAA